MHEDIYNEIELIRNETEPGANSAERISGVLQMIADKALPKFKEITGNATVTMSEQTDGLLPVGSLAVVEELNEYYLFDDFSNIGFPNLLTTDDTFEATGTTPTRWIYGTRVFNSNDSTEVPYGDPLVIGNEYYLTQSVEQGGLGYGHSEETYPDDLSNIGFEEIDVPFTITDDTPTAWLSQTVVTIIDIDVNSFVNTVDQNITFLAKKEYVGSGKAIRTIGVLVLSSDSGFTPKIYYDKGYTLEDITKLEIQLPTIDDGDSFIFGGPFKVEVYGEFIEGLTGFMISTDTAPECDFEAINLLDMNREAFHSGTGDWPEYGDTVYLDQYGTILPPPPTGEAYAIPRIPYEDYTQGGLKTNEEGVSIEWGCH